MADSDTDNNIDDWDSEDIEYEGLEGAPQLTAAQARDYAQWYRETHPRKRRAQIADDVLTNNRAALMQAYSQVYKEQDPNALVFAKKPKPERVPIVLQTGRRREKAASKREQLNNLIKAIPGFENADEDDLAEARAYAANMINKPKRKQNKIMRRAMKTFGIPTVNKKDPMYKRQKALQKLRHRFPNAIDDPYLVSKLRDVRGVRYNKSLLSDQLKDGDGNRLFEKNWMRKTPQQLSSRERDAAARLFAELNGVLGWQPKYDKRFLTQASAMEALNDIGPNKAYTYDLYDMDDNLYTPGTLIVKEKPYAGLDKDGNPIQKPGRIISVGGYLMGDATSNQSEQRMKDMLYYEKYPTAKARKNTGLRTFLSEENLLKPDISAGLKRVKKMIEGYFTAVLKARKPTKVDVAQADGTIKKVEQPALINLSLQFQDGRKDLVIFTVSSIAWNTIVSSVGQLYTSMMIYPYLNFDVAGLQALRRAFAAHAFLDQYRGDNVFMNVALNFNKYYTNKRIEAYVLRNKFIKKQMNDIINSYKTLPEQQQNLIKLIPSLLAIVVMHLMNSNLSSILGSLAGKNGRRETGYQKDLLASFYQMAPEFTFATDDNYTALSNIVNNDQLPVIALTPKSWEKAKTDCNIVELGTELLSTVKYADVRMDPNRLREMELMYQNDPRGILPPFLLTGIDNVKNSNKARGLSNSSNSSSSSGATNDNNVVVNNDEELDTDNWISEDSSDDGAQV